MCCLLCVPYNSRKNHPLLLFSSMCSSAARHYSRKWEMMEKRQMSKLCQNYKRVYQFIFIWKCHTHTHTRTLINFCNNIIICIDNSHHQMNCDIFSQRFWLIIIYATFSINRCTISTMYMNTLCLWIWRNQLVPGYINRITSCLSAFTMRNDKSNNKWNRWRMKKKKKSVHCSCS